MHSYIACILRLSAAITLWLAAFGPALAHEMSMAEMEIRQVTEIDFVWQWTASGSKPAADALAIRWPDGCAIDADTNVLRCANGGLRGTLSVVGVGDAYSAAVVKVLWKSGERQVFTLTARQPSVWLFGGAEDDRSWTEIASAYAVLGVEHILSGIDHLAFVIALVLLVGFDRRLVWTITAFTAAHSLTLALSALGLLTLRPPPVEAVIALSIVLVAGEALHRRQTLSRRWPALVAFLFGLVHGLGFAGALKEIGLPDNHRVVALLTFNVGVELGQLAVVGLAWVIWRATTRLPQLVPARRAVLYVIGSVAAYWSWSRLAAMVA